MVSTKSIICHAVIARYMAKYRKLIIYQIVQVHPKSVGCDVYLLWANID